MERYLSDIADMDAAEAIKREIVAMLDHADERQLRIIYQFVLPLKEKRSGVKAAK